MNSFVYRSAIEEMAIVIARLREGKDELEAAEVKQFEEWCFLAEFIVKAGLFEVFERSLETTDWDQDRREAILTFMADSPAVGGSL